VLRKSKVTSRTAGMIRTSCLRGADVAVLLLCLVAFLFRQPASAAEITQIDGSPTLFAVMAALNAAGMDTTSGSAVNAQLRAAVLEHVEAKKPPVMNQLKNFVESHKSAGITAYITFALSVNDGPTFEPRFRTGDLHPDMLILEGFGPLLTRFYQEADIEGLWKKVQPALEQTLAHNQPGVLKAVEQANGYTRSFTSGYMGRKFVIYIDLLGTPGKTTSRTFAEEYFLVVAPAQQVPTQEIRHAYLHYIIDPLPYKFSSEVMKKRGLMDFAEAAPLLDESYKQDFLLLTTECVIKAIEARLAPEGAARRDIIDTALAEGYILTPYFAEQLPAYEKQETALRLYFPDLVSPMDVKKEARRLETVTFAAKRESAPRQESRVQAKLTPGQELIEKGEQLSSSKEYEKAREQFLKVLELDEKALHGRAYFGLARIAAIGKNPELAQSLFTKTLQMETDAATKSWSEYYLGRLSELSGDSESAIRYYRSVLANQQGSPAAKREAEKALSAAQTQK
jgi:tetratricopeptide (TPR) repeat protein